MQNRMAKTQTVKSINFSLENFIVSIYAKHLLQLKKLILKAKKKCFSSTKHH